MTNYRLNWLIVYAQKNIGPTRQGSGQIPIVLNKFFKLHLIYITFKMGFVLVIIWLFRVISPRFIENFQNI